MEVKEGKVKGILIQINRYFEERERRQHFEINPENYVINRQNGIIKNMLRLTNKTMIGFQRVQINKKAVFVSLLGVGLGFLSANIEDSYWYWRKNHQKLVRDIVIQ